MASARFRKRCRTDDLSQEHHPNKRTKLRTQSRGPSNFPPDFWDSLSKVPLTRRALRELDRRNSARPVPGPAAPAVYTIDRAQFAKHGGPDLRHLRGFSAVPTMAPSKPAASGQPTKSTTESTKHTPAIRKKSSAYDKAFEGHLYEHNIHLADCESEPDDLRLADLYQPRLSLSPSRFSESAFKRFQREHKHLGSEQDVMRKLIPVIAGNADIPNSGGVLFSNLQSITDDQTVDPKPDFYDGARFGDIDTVVRKELNHLIVPTTSIQPPIAPNFFLEAKDSGGGADVATRQAGHDGAIGARAMHALHNYGAEEPTFDGNAYTYSSVYHAGTGSLQLYAHHVTPPTAPDGRPTYHMTQVGGWCMTGDADTFRRGATAFRNARDMAQVHRDGFIRAANARARQTNAEGQSGSDVTLSMMEHSGVSVTNEVTGREDVLEPPAALTGTHAASQATSEGPTLPGHLRDEEEEDPDQQESPSPGAEMAIMSFTTTFTSGFGTPSQSGAKRNRTSDSPPSKSQPAKKQISVEKTR